MMPNITATSSAQLPQAPANLQPKAGHADHAMQANPRSDGSVRNPNSRPTAPLPEAATGQTPPATTNQPDRQVLSAAVDELNKQAKNLPQTNLQFSLDNESGVIVVKVMDVEKDQVIRQIPREEVLQMMAFLKEAEAKKAQGMNFTASGARGSAAGSALEGLLLHAKA